MNIHIYKYLCICIYTNPKEIQGWMPLQTSQLVAHAT